MQIGITYDLKDEYQALGYSPEQVAEFDRIDTIEAIERALQRAGHEVTRIGRAQALIRRLAAGQRWQLVFNIAEGVRGQARESQVPAILDVMGIGYTFSDPLVLAVCLDKGLAKLCVQRVGIRTPEFDVVQNADMIRQVDLPFPLFAKPIAEGTSLGVNAASKVEDAAQLDEVCRDLLSTYRRPVLVERFLPGREFTVGIVGTGEAA